jgi:glycosyltransferase involved in cell wall biosynthesis
MLRLESYVTGKAQAIFYASDLSLKDAQKNLPVVTQKRFKIPLPINGNFYAVPRRQISTPTVLLVGRLEAKKGIAELVEALPLIAASIPDVRCLIIGPDGKDVDGRSMRQRLETVLSKLHMTDRVEFVGPASYDQLPDYFARAQVSVNPSQYESFGMTSLEALTAGLHIVVYDTVGFVEWVQPEWGIVVKAHSIAEMARAIVAELNNEKNIDRKSVYEQFSADTVAKEVLTIYRSLSKSKRL